MPFRKGKLPQLPQMATGVEGIRLTWLEVGSKVQDKLKEACGEHALDDAIIIDLHRERFGLILPVLGIVWGVVLILMANIEFRRPRTSVSRRKTITKFHSTSQKVLWAVIVLCVAAGYFGGEAIRSVCGGLGVFAAFISIIGFFSFIYVRPYFPRESALPLTTPPDAASRTHPPADPASSTADPSAHASSRYQTATPPPNRTRARVAPTP